MNWLMPFVQVSSRKEDENMVINDLMDLIKKLLTKQNDRWLKSLKHKTMPYSQVVRQRNLTPIYAGSNPARVVCSK